MRLIRGKPSSDTTSAFQELRLDWKLLGLLMAIGVLIGCVSSIKQEYGEPVSDNECNAVVYESEQEQRSVCIVQHKLEPYTYAMFPLSFDGKSTQSFVSLRRTAGEFAKHEYGRSGFVVGFHYVSRQIGRIFIPYKDFDFAPYYYEFIVVVDDGPVLTDSELGSDIPVEDLDQY